MTNEMRAVIYQLIADAERWADNVSPVSGDMTETQKAWRQGFAAAMQQIEAKIVDVHK